MGIRETKERKLNLTSMSISTAERAARFSKEKLAALSMGNEGGEEDDDPTRYLSAREAAQWKRLTKKKKDKYIAAGERSPVKPGRSSDGIREYVRGKALRTQRGLKEKRREDIRGRREAVEEKPGRRHATSSWRKEDRSRAPDWRQESGRRAASGTGRQAMQSAAKDVAQHAVEKGGASISTGAGAAAGGVAGASVIAGKKAAEKFRVYMQERTMAAEHNLKSVQERYEGVRSENREKGTMPSALKYTAATVGATAVAAVALIMKALLSFIALIVGAVLSLFIPMVVIVAITAAVFSLFASISSNRSGYGLPPFITEDMMEAFFEEQSMYGIPVSTGVAQTIQESGFGRYGPGGGEGKGLSKLAYDYRNLFGIKYSSSDAFASGSVDMRTGEETQSGGGYVVVDAFAVYASYADCIKRRTGMLLNARYSPHVSPFLNSNDGSYTPEKANGFAAGIKAGGWATSVSYVEGLIDKMEQYDLYRFDNMTYEEYQAGMATGEGYDGTVTPTMERIVQVAESNTGAYPCTPDYCARWVRGVYEAAGAPTIPWGNAIDVWNVHKDTGSTDLSSIPPGAIVCGSGVGYMGSLYGHVGIYLGDGMVVSNVGRHKIETLESFGSWQTASCQGHVGLIGWVFPGGVPSE